MKILDELKTYSGDLRFKQMVTAHEQLITNLEHLKLKELKNHLDETINFINKNNLSFVDELIKLILYEIDF